MKAINCREGKLAMEEFCQENGIRYEICGKVIVATEKRELPRIQEIYKRCQANGVKCEIIGRERLKELEPHCAGIQAIHVPETGIIDYVDVCLQLANKVENGEKPNLSQHTGKRTSSLTAKTYCVIADNMEVQAHDVINCAGLQSDRTKAGGQKPEVKIIPFRGEYFELSLNANHLCKGP